MNTRQAVEAICKLNNTTANLKREEVLNGPILFTIEIPAMEGIHFNTSLLSPLLIKTISFSTEAEAFEAALKHLQRLKFRMKIFKDYLLAKQRTGPLLTRHEDLLSEINRFLANFNCPSFNSLEELEFKLAVR